MNTLKKIPDYVVYYKYQGMTLDHYFSIPEDRPRMYPIECAELELLKLYPHPRLDRIIILDTYKYR